MPHLTETIQQFGIFSLYVGPPVAVRPAWAAAMGRCSTGAGGKKGEDKS